MSWSCRDPLRKPRRTLHDVAKLLNTDATRDLVQEQNKTAEQVAEVHAEPQREVNVQNSVQSGVWYRILWARPSGRKKKIWEGDGQLKVESNCATLCDEEGKIISTTSAPAPNLLFVGSIFMLASKEIEIVEICQGSFSVIKETENKKPEFKPKNILHKNKKFKSNNIVSGTSAGFNQPYNKEQFADLILPTPPNEHQWKFNTYKKPITPVKVDAFLTLRLRPHQREGVAFMYECIMGFKNPTHTGVILADEMGLGKTLQCITLIWTLLKHGPYGFCIIRRALVVTPSTLCAPWNKEFLKWLGRERIQPYLIDNTNKPLGFNARTNSVMIISYERLVKHMSDIESLNFDIIICDEAHRLKNANVKAAQALKQLNCNKRVLLTGTPMQNDLQEFFVLADIANPGIFGTYAEYKEQFEDPILHSQKPDCSKELRLIGEERANNLKFSTSSFILRRTQSIMNGILPSKTEYVICCHLTDMQREIYSSAIDEWWSNKEMSNTQPPLSVIVLLKKICNHPALLKTTSKCLDDKYDISNFDTVNAIKASSNDFSQEHSSKIIVLNNLLRNAVMLQNEKVVIVSYSTQVLDIIGKECTMLEMLFLRLDGNTPIQQRQGIVESFNMNLKLKNAYSKVPYVLLLSSKAGGVGLSLPAASRLILFDSDWNPAVDNQAMARIWRDGQKKPVHIYRFLTTGTIEEKIYQRQMFKTGLSDAILDTKKLKNTLKLCETELKDLFTLSSDSESTTHDTLDCSCSGDGSENNVANDTSLEIEEDQNFKKNNRHTKESKINSINQLKMWRHLRPPYNDQFLQESGLCDVDEHISFIFQKVYEKI